MKTYLSRLISLYLTSLNFLKNLGAIQPGQKVLINGAAGSATVTVAAAASAKTVAGQINAQTGTTGVWASARTEFDLTAFTASASYSINVTSDNSTAVTISA